MKKVIRKNIFETNKSNVHSIPVGNGIFIGDSRLIMFGDSKRFWMAGDLERYMKNEESNS